MLLKLRKTRESQGPLRKEIRNQMMYCVPAKVLFVTERDLMKFWSFTTKIRITLFKFYFHEKDRLKCFRGVKI